MTKRVDALEAEAQFSALLEEIEQGKEVTITKHGRAVAKLVPVNNTQHLTPAEAIDGLVQFRQRLALKADWKTLRDTGRR